jgi:hypothetical protein
MIEKPVYHLIRVGSMVETGFSIKLWVSTGLNLVQPHLGDEVGGPALDGVRRERRVRPLGVALQVEFEKANFETGFSLDRL